MTTARPDFGATLGAPIERVQPSREVVAQALEGAWAGWDQRVSAHAAVTDTEYEAMADAVLNLFAAQPTVAEVRAEALRDAAEKWGAGDWHEQWSVDGVDDDVSAVRSTVAWLRARADRIEADHG